MKERNYSSKREQQKQVRRRNNSLLFISAMFPYYYLQPVGYFQIFCDIWNVLTLWSHLYISGVMEWVNQRAITYQYSI